MFWGGSITKRITINSKPNYPKPRLELLNVRKFTSYQYTSSRYKIYKCARYTKDRTIHTLGPSMPQVALTPLGLPSLATNHSST